MDNENKPVEETKAPETQEVKAPKKKSKALFIILPIVGVVVIAAAVLVFFYFFSPKTAPWLCKHVYSKSTCEHDMECPRCGEFLKKAKKHDMEPATCEEPETCSECGYTDGEPLGHKWLDATCEAPMTCSVCNKTQGDLADHIWRAATCTEPKTCTVCGKTEGSKNEHFWTEATCTSPKICVNCGAKEGEALQHDCVDGVCKNCNKFIATKDNLKDVISFSKANVKKYSSSSSWVGLQITNKTKKTISSVTFILSFYDSNKNAIVNGKCTYNYKIKAGKKSNKKYGWIIIQPSSKLKNYTISNIVITYADGTEQNFGTVTLP